MTSTDTTATHTRDRTPPALATPALTAGAVTFLAAVARLLLADPPEPSLALLPAWVAGAGALLGILAALAGTRAGPHAPAAARRVVTASWAACALLVAQTADGIAFDVVGMVMTAVSALTGEPLAVALPVDPPGFAVRVLAAGTAALLARQALALRRGLGGGCGSCGRAATDPARPAPTWPAYTAAGLAGLYALQKLHWGLGGTLGLAHDDVFGEASLLTPGLGDTAVLALVGVGLALALARPWGLRLPRTLLLAAAGLGTLMLVPVGIIGTATTWGNLAGLAASDELGLAPWVYLAEYPGFLAWGTALGAAALAFSHRTRRACRGCARG